MAASSTSASVRLRNALVGLAAASAVAALLVAVPAAAATPGARTYALTPLEERATTPELEPGEERQPVIGYLRLTEEGWKLDMLPGAVERTGPLPVLTTAADAAIEYAPSYNVYPYAPLLRMDF
jgi:hypothetical protein